MNATKLTPGYGERLAIWFTHSKRGQKMAWHFSYLMGRAFRVPLADAELWIATGLADETDGHPMRIPGGR